MANTTADKLALLEATKAEMKSAINGSGSTVGDVFSAYPAAITSGKAAIAQATTNKGVATASTDTFAQMAANIEQIETGGVESVLVTIKINGPSFIDLYYTKVLEDGSLSFASGQAMMSKALTDNMPSGSVIVGFVSYTYGNALSFTGATISKKYEPGSRRDTTIVWKVN